VKYVRALASSIRDFWFDHLWIDLLIAAALVGTHLAIVLLTGRLDILSVASLDERRGLYSASAVVVSLIGAFSGVAIGQVASGKGARIRALKSAAAKPLANSWRSIYMAAIASACLALLCLAIDVKGREGGAAAPFVMRWLFEFGLIYCVAKFVRLMALFHPIIESSAKDDAESEAGPKPALVPSPNWRDKRTG
jgi:hypothetical protein